jgi:hypothetical protein
MWYLRCQAANIRTQYPREIIVRKSIYWLLYLEMFCVYAMPLGVVKKVTAESKDQRRASYAPVGLWQGMSLFPPKKSKKLCGF